ncbi:hypothetical protein ABT47_05980 [Shewanella xiamenensis]|nr:hypothetical protein ABT47_05980 [Shewanella xiamenensis]
MQHISFANSIKYHFALSVAKVGNSMHLIALNAFDLTQLFDKKVLKSLMVTELQRTNTAETYAIKHAIN